MCFYSSHAHMKAYYFDNKDSGSIKVMSCAMLRGCLVFNVI